MATPVRPPLKFFKPATSVCLAEELGWHRIGSARNEYEGYFRAHGLTFPGYAVVRDDHIQLFIRRPPTAMLNHIPERGCFHAHDDEFWLVSFTPDRRPKDLSSGI